MRAVVLAVIAAGCARAPATPTTTTPATLSTLEQLEASQDLDGNVIGRSDAPATVVIVMASWCSHCRDELVVFDRVRARHPSVRWLAINYKQHEEYDARGNAEAIRALARDVPWLRVVPAGEALFTAVGRPTKIPTVLIFDRRGAVLADYQRTERPPPDERELDQLLAQH